MIPIVSVKNLSKSFGKYHIIDNLSLKINPGTVYGLVGLNGAGKTTLLRLTLGLLKPDNGIIEVAGHTPWKHEQHFYRKCGVVLENNGFWGNLTAIENCRIYAAAKGISSEDLDNYLQAFWSKNAIFTANKKVKHFSRGQRVLCALCRAFMGSPKIFFLDEPTVALDLNAHEQFKKLIIDARNRGAALIISSHQLDTIDELCNRVGILRDGTLTEIGHQSDIKDSATWFIDTEENDTIKTILETSGAKKIRYDHGWQFSIDSPSTAIPLIIRHLVGRGYDIREVRPFFHGYGSAIRTLYCGSKEEKVL